MSRFATLPNATSILRVDRTADGEEVPLPLEPRAHVDVAGARAIYADGHDAVVEFPNHVQFRFRMFSTEAARDAAAELVRIAR